MASGSGDGKIPDLPRGLIDRRGAPAGKARLTSFRNPRDLSLTLGGAQKKVYVPNIPVRREKQEKREEIQKTQNNQKIETSKERSRGRGRDGRGRGRGRGGENLVQLHSVFEERAAVQKFRGQGSSSQPGPGFGGGGKREAKPIIKTERPENSLSDKQEIFARALDEKAMMDAEEDYAGVKPIRFPKRRVRGAESIDAEDTKTDNTDQRKDKLKCAKTFLDAKESGEKKLMFFRMTSALPGVRTEVSASEENKNKDNEEDCPRTTLRDLSEGYLGKLRVRRSGKVELVLGDVPFIVEEPRDVSQNQELMSVRTDEGDERMTMLGHIENSMIARLDVKNLLKDERRSKDS